jgi:hypothetical protein
MLYIICCKPTHQIMLFCLKRVFFEFFLCLSRAWFGKLVVLIWRLEKKDNNAHAPVLLGPLFVVAQSYCQLAALPWHAFSRQRYPRRCVVHTHPRHTNKPILTLQGQISQRELLSHCITLSIDLTPSSSSYP